jgi:hypothetical protein
VTTPSDRYFTPQELLDLVLEQWPDGIDLDPCWDPCSRVAAARVYDHREGQDGLELAWGGRVFLNPPYSPAPAAWLERAARHASGGGEVLALVPAAVSSDYWARHVWPTASVCCLNPRPKFGVPGGKRDTVHLRCCCVLYYGEHHDRFAEVWAKRGQIVRAAGPRPGRVVNLAREA